MKIRYRNIIAALVVSVLSLPNRLPRSLARRAFDRSGSKRLTVNARLGGERWRHAECAHGHRVDPSAGLSGSRLRHERKATRDHRPQRAGARRVHGSQVQGWLADTVWVYDERLRRHSFFTRDGRLLRTVALETSGRDARVVRDSANASAGGLLPWARRDDGTLVGSATVVRSGTSAGQKKVLGSSPMERRSNWPTSTRTAGRMQTSGHDDGGGLRRTVAMPWLRRCQIFGVHSGHRAFPVRRARCASWDHSRGMLGRTLSGRRSRACAQARRRSRSQSRGQRVADAQSAASVVHVLSAR